MDLEKKILHIRKSYQRLERKDVITEPKMKRVIETLICRISYVRSWRTISGCCTSVTVISGYLRFLNNICFIRQVEFDETKMPFFEADNDDFTLILYNLNYGSNYATHANEEKIHGDTQDDTQGDVQDDTQEKIVKMIKENPQVSTADMTKKL